MINIIQVFGSLNAGGAESRMLDVFRAIDRTKYQFIFVTLDTSDNQFYESEIRSLGGEIIKISSPRQVGVLKHLRQLREVFANLKTQGANVVHSHTSYHSGMVLAAAKAAGIKVRIAQARTTSSINKNTLSQKAMIAIGQRLLDIFATHRMALNEETAIALFGKRNYATGKVSIIKNAIPLKRFQDPKDCDDLAFLPKDAVVIGHIGRFSPMKNHRFLIDFYEEFYRKEPRAHLVLVGDGPLRKDIEYRVAEKGLTAKVHFMGLRKDIPSILKRVNLFVFPSIFEGLPGSVLEAKAAGIPCLIADTITPHVNMSLGLLKYVSLKAPMPKWIEYASMLLMIEHPPYQLRYDAFNSAGFTLEYELKQLIAVYENAYNNNDNL